MSSADYLVRILYGTRVSLFVGFLGWAIRADYRADLWGRAMMAKSGYGRDADRRYYLFLPDMLMVILLSAVLKKC